MTIAILSDIHDNVWNLRAVLSQLKSADALLCCGDLCAPFILPLLADGFPDRPIHVVFGNNDGDLYRITSVASRYDQVHLHGELFRGELGGRRFMMSHYDTVAQVIAPREADVVCYGHNHAVAIERRDRCWFINPGAVMGYTPAGNREIAVSYALYDTDAGAPELRQIGLGNRTQDESSPMTV